MTQVQFPARIHISELPGHLLWGKKEQNALGKYVTWSLTIHRRLPTNTWTSWHSRGDTTSPNCPACFLQHSQSVQRESNLTRGKFTSTPPGFCYMQSCIEPKGPSFPCVTQYDKPKLEFSGRSTLMFKQWVSHPCSHPPSHAVLFVHSTPCVLTRSQILSSVLSSLPGEAN